MKFIYAFNEDDRAFLKLKGYNEVSVFELEGKETYAFDNSHSTYATFSECENENYLITDVALFTM